VADEPELELELLENASVGSRPKGRQVRNILCCQDSISIVFPPGTADEKYTATHLDTSITKQDPRIIPELSHDPKNISLDTQKSSHDKNTKHQVRILGLFSLINSLLHFRFRRSHKGSQRNKASNIRLCKLPGSMVDMQPQFRCRGLACYLPGFQYSRMFFACGVCFTKFVSTRSSPLVYPSRFLATSPPRLPHKL
jgi:hypothetical protein